MSDEIKRIEREDEIVQAARAAGVRAERDRVLEILDVAFSGTDTLKYAWVCRRIEGGQHE